MIKSDKITVTCQSSPEPHMELFYLLTATTAIIFVRADVEGQREVPQDLSEDMYAPNSVPMMGKKGDSRYRPLPMLRLKKDKKENHFVYRTPWHIGKRTSIPDIYTASWIGSLYKPSSADLESKPNRRMRFRSEASKGRPDTLYPRLENISIQRRRVP